MAGLIKGATKDIVYKGTVRHRRFEPKNNTFSYPLNMWYLNLDNLDLLKPKWYSPFRFKAQDYLDANDQPLKQQVLNKVSTELDASVSNSITEVCLLTQLRCFNYVINPISIFYCFDKDKQLIALIVEVTNTPWGERIDYVLRCNPQHKIQRIDFNKAMHVSPFNPMDMQYQWSNNCPNEQLNVHLSCLRSGDKVLDATLKLEKGYEPFSLKGFNMLTTWRIAFLIYWQAAKLYLVKRLPFYGNPSNTATETVIEKTS